MTLESEEGSPVWPLFSRYAHVLACLVENPVVRMREVAQELEVTERSVQKLILRLEACEVITRRREGRNNRYEVNFDAPLRHSFEGGIDFRRAVELIVEAREARCGSEA